MAQRRNQVYPLRVTLSVVIITYNEEANLGRTLESVLPLVADGKGEIIVVDSGSTDRTVEIAKSFGAKVLVEEWKGYAAQKNSAIDKASGDWILSLDADEELDSNLIAELGGDTGGGEASSASKSHAWRLTMSRGDKGAINPNAPVGFWIRRKNCFLGRWIKHGGFWPDPKLRLFRRGSARFENRLVHEDAKLSGPSGRLSGALIHHSYPTLSDYFEHMNRYSSLGAEMVAGRSASHPVAENATRVGHPGRARFSLINIVLRPLLTFIYNYVFRLGFLDGREGLLLHLYHAAYVSWKYAKAWEMSRARKA